MRPAMIVISPLKSRKRGFTLIEVVGGLIVFAAVAFGSLGLFGRAMERTNVLQIVPEVMEIQTLLRPLLTDAETIKNAKRFSYRAAVLVSGRDGWSEVTTVGNSNNSGMFGGYKFTFNHRDPLGFHITFDGVDDCRKFLGAFHGLSPAQNGWKSPGTCDGQSRGIYWVTFSRA